MNRREVVGALLTATSAAPAVATAAANAAPAPLSARGEANLVAFARLVAYVRFFHPSDEAAAVDWNSFVVANVPTIEAAKTRSELLARLDAVFRPIAPTLVLHPAGKAMSLTPPSVAEGTLVAWRHCGVGLTKPSIYSSQRVAVGDGLPKVTRLDLGGEIGAVMPTTAHSRDLAAKPASPAPVASFSGDDRSVRLAAIILGWGVLRQFYPYFDVVQTDWDAELPKALRAAAIDPDGRQFRVTLARMVAALHDCHGNVYYRSPPLGLPLAWAWIEGRVVITGLPEGGLPGLSVGAVVKRIDGVDIGQRLALLDTEVCAATPQWRRVKVLQLLQQRDDATPAILEGEGPDGQPFRAALAPASWDAVRDVKKRMALANFSELRPGVVYVDLVQVTEQSLNENLALLTSAKGVVLDDRGYPSVAARRLLPHLSDQTLKSSLFEMPTFTLPDQREATFENKGWTLPPMAPRVAGKLVLLTGGGSISYAESWAGVFENARLGAIVGGPTAGTNGDINRMMLPGGYAVLFTGLRVRKPDGSPHHGVGIIPTHPVEQTLAGVRAGRDDVLERGLALAEA